MSYVVDLAAMRGEAEATPQLSPEKPYKSSLVTLNRTLYSSLDKQEYVALYCDA